MIFVFIVFVIKIVIGYDVSICCVNCCLKEKLLLIVLMGVAMVMT